jgi:uncharacterized protein
MAKPFGAVCNLDCSYCYYLEKEKMYDTSERFRMSEQTLEKFIDEYIASQNVPVIQFIWHGGEPTMLGMDYYKKALDLQNQYSRGKTIENVLQTNGTLLNDDWCRFFRDNQFLIGISIDGPEHIHDRYRMNKAGKPSFAQVMKGLELLVKHQVEFNTLSVVNDYNALYPLETYRFLKSAGSRYMQFTPIVERIATNVSENAMHLLPNHLTVLPSYDPAVLRSYGLTILRSQLAPWSVKPLDYGRFLCEIFDDWVLHDVGMYFVPTFDSILANWVGSMTSICVHAETCGHAGAIEHNGDLFACDHYVFPEHKLGNIYTDSLVSMMYSPGQIAFGQAKRNALPQQCRECDYLFACNGECPKNRINKTPTGEPGLNYLCSGLRLFYAHVAPYMDFMAEELANERPPANVMAWAQERIKNKPLVKNAQVEKPVMRTMIKPNVPCPCGSGKKYKQCCRNKSK